MASGGAGGHFSKDEAVHMEMDVQVFGEQMFVRLAGIMGHRADSGLLAPSNSHPHPPPHALCRSLGIVPLCARTFP